MLSLVTFQPPLCMFVRVNTQGGGGERELVGVRAAHKDDVLYRAGPYCRIHRRPVGAAGKVGLPVPTRKEIFVQIFQGCVNDFFSVAAVQGGIHAGMLPRPGLVKYKPS